MMTGEMQTKNSNERTNEERRDLETLLASVATLAQRQRSRSNDAPAHASAENRGKSTQS